MADTMADFVTAAIIQGAEFGFLIGGMAYLLGYAFRHIVKLFAALSSG